MVLAFLKTGEVYDNLVRRVWVAKCDPALENKDLAEQLWKSAELSVSSMLCLLVLEDVAHPVGVLKQAAADALAALLENNRDQTRTVLTVLLERYDEKLEMAPPLMDSLGRIVEQAIDHWEPRSGIALALAKIQTFYDELMINSSS